MLNLPGHHQFLQHSRLSNAVSRVIAWLAAVGTTVPSADTGALSIALVWAAVVLAYDGTTVTMSDTPANQKTYPQHSNSVGRMWFSIGKVGGVVLCDHALQCWKYR